MHLSRSSYLIADRLSAFASLNKLDSSFSVVVCNCLMGSSVAIARNVSEIDSVREFDSLRSDRQRSWTFLKCTLLIRIRAGHSEEAQIVLIGQKGSQPIRLLRKFSSMITSILFPVINYTIRKDLPAWECTLKFAIFHHSMWVVVCNDHS